MTDKTLLSLYLIIYSYLKRLELVNERQFIACLLLLILRVLSQCGRSRLRGRGGCLSFTHHNYHKGNTLHWVLFKRTSPLRVLMPGEKNVLNNIQAFLQVQPYPSWLTGRVKKKKNTVLKKSYVQTGEARDWQRRKVLCINVYQKYSAH